ncbi:unnamed protein product [Effrenium voratum]|nr:unnamed protein product [Effrenium voratum]CAJ1461944.1 unnamed protein product [Effrenium voratum]
MPAVDTYMEVDKNENLEGLVEETPVQKTPWRFLGLFAVAALALLALGLASTHGSVLRGTASDIVSEESVGDDVDVHQEVTINGVPFFGVRAGKASAPLGKCRTFAPGFIKRGRAEFATCGQHTELILFEDAKCDEKYPYKLGSCGANSNKNYCSTLNDQGKHTRWAADYNAFVVRKC